MEINGSQAHRTPLTMVSLYDSRLWGSKCWHCWNLENTSDLKGENIMLDRNTDMDWEMC